MPEQSREPSDGQRPHRKPPRGPLRVTDEELAFLGRAMGKLSPRQLEVLDGVLRMRCAKEIAVELGLEVSTVNRYIASMCVRAHVSDGARGLFLRATELIHRKRDEDRDHGGGG